MTNQSRSELLADVLIQTSFVASRLAMKLLRMAEAYEEGMKAKVNHNRKPHEMRHKRKTI
jgi:NTP pyrophosphatase (non-canonical NTP hydrolase)